MRKPGSKQAIGFLSPGENDLVLKAWPGVFTQVNRSVNRLLIREVCRQAERIKPERVLDLYSGLGNFSLPLSASTREVLAVEAHGPAVANARLNIKENRVKNVRLIKESSERAVTDLVREGRRFDLILLDPPRAGARDMAADLARLAPKSILYVSCHPAAMMRDLPQFRSLGYQVGSLQVFDMFPQTSHIECLASMQQS